MIARALFIAVPLLAVLLAAPAGVAQTAATPDQVAEARASADRLIAQADAGAWFENITTDAVPTVRHRPSGMTCRFAGETRYDYIRIFDPQADSPGDDVGCNTRAPEGDFSSYATRYADQFSAAEILEDALAAIVGRFPEAKPHSGLLSAASLPGWEPTQVGGFDVVVEGKPRLTLALVTHKGEWSFKGRATGWADNPNYGTIASLTFLQTLPGAQQ